VRVCYQRYRRIVQITVLRRAVGDDTNGAAVVRPVLSHLASKVLHMLNSPAQDADVRVLIAVAATILQTAASRNSNLDEQV
jgi:hypothetical protein